MFKTKINKRALSILALLVMLVMAFVPAIFSLSVKEVRAANTTTLNDGGGTSTTSSSTTSSGNVSVTAKLSDDQESIIVTVKGATATPTGTATVKEGEGGANIGNFTQSDKDKKEYTATVTLTDSDKIGLVEIKVGDKTVNVTVNITQLKWYKGSVQPIIKVLEMVVPILLGLVGTAGTIFVVILGVNYSKAEDSSKREEAKKRLIGAVTGLVVMIALLIVVFLFTKYAPDIIKWIKKF